MLTLEIASAKPMQAGLGDGPVSIWLIGIAIGLFMLVLRRPAGYTY
jgi:hypothetical protein